MLQVILLLTLLIAAKLIWDIYKDQKPSAPKTRSKAGQVIDLSNAWINPDDLPYKKREHLLSGRELALYQILNDMVDINNYVIFPKVRLADLLSLPAHAKNREEYLHRIKEKNVDFLVCERENLKPVLVVLGEGKSEGKKKQLTDRITRSSIEAAGITVISINLSNLPAPDDLLKNLEVLGLEL